MNKFMIIIEGPMGSGKSTIGNLVAEKLKRTAHLSTDKIKFFVSDFKRCKEDNEMTARVMQRMCEEYINQDINLLISQGFWRKQYVEPYLKMAKKHKLDLYFFQLEAPKAELLKRIEARGLGRQVKTPVPKSRILKNLKTWEENRYEMGEVFDSSKLSAEKIAKIILKKVKAKK